MPRGRPKVTDRLCIKVDDKLVVMTDTYNVILAEVYHTGDKIVPRSLGFFNQFDQHLVEVMAQQVSKETVDSYRNRVQGITTTYKDGKLKVKLPQGFQSDPNPFGEDNGDE